MSKYTFLLFKTILFTAFLSNSLKILGNDGLRKVDLDNFDNKVEIKAQKSKKNEVRDWIELFKKEIRSVGPNEIEGNEEIKKSGKMETNCGMKGKFVFLVSANRDKLRRSLSLFGEST